MLSNLKTMALAVVFALTLILNCNLTAQDDPPGSGTVGRIRNLGDWRYPSDEALMLEAFRNLDRDMPLYSFCQRGILGDTGLAACYFGGTTEERIIKTYLPDKRFKEALAKSGAAIEYFVAPPSDSISPSEQKKEASVLTLYQSQSNKHLESKLTKEELDKLPGVYLRIEGLMALCRPEFEKLFESNEKREAVRAIVEAEYENRVSKINRALFAFSLENQRTAFVGNLRRCAVDVD